MNKIFIFYIGIAAILYVGIMNFSIQTSTAFPQNSNPKMMMGPVMGMGQTNQTGMMGMQQGKLNK